MVHYAVDMKLGSGAPVTNLLLSGISVLDDLGAWEWNLRLLSLVWFLIFAGVRYGVGKSKGIEWYAFIHALITGIGGVICAYMTFVMAEPMTGTPEPLGMVLCGGALTSFHRVLPTVTLGYAIIEFIDGLSLGADFLSHGLVLLTFALYMCEHEKNEILSTMLALEFSSIFYNLSRAEFMTPILFMINTAAFVVTFFLCRVVFGPWSWYKMVSVLYNEGMSEDALACAPTGHRHFIFVSGMFFHVLNTYWFYKILQKVHRTIKGTDKRKKKEDEQYSGTDKEEEQTNGEDGSAGGGAAVSIAGMKGNQSKGVSSTVVVRKRMGGVSHMVVARVDRT